MKKNKRKLNLDDLKIESFETTVASEVAAGWDFSRIATNICYNTCGAGDTCGPPCSPTSLYC